MGIKSSRAVHIKSAPITEEEIDRISVHIGLLVKKIRQKRTSQERLSYELGIDKSHLIKLEKGENIGIIMLLKILHGLEMPVDKFFKLLDEELKKKPRADGKRRAGATKPLPKVAP